MLVEGVKRGPGAVTDLPAGPNQLYLFISGVTYQFQHFLRRSEHFWNFPHIYTFRTTFLEAIKTHLFFSTLVMHL